MLLKTASISVWHSYCSKSVRKLSTSEAALLSFRFSITKMKLFSVVITLAFLMLAGAVQAQPYAFSYQGKLTENGIAANGIYDFRFRLYTSSGGITQVGGDRFVDDLALVNGIFTTSIDWGYSIFDGSNLWLEISARPGSSVGAYTVQAPRQQILAVPYANTARQVIGEGILGSAYVVSGSGAIPGYSFQSDVNTGIFNPTSNVLGFSTGGFERVRIDPEGDVSIGTGASSNYKLTVKDSNHHIALLDTESDKVWTLTTVSNSGFGIYEDGITSRFTIDAGGNAKLGSKAIVTSRNATELQVLTLTGNVTYTRSSGSSGDVDLTWGDVGFSAAPTVSFAGVTATSATIGGAMHFTVFPYEITTTGCKLRFTNTASTTQSFTNVGFNFQVIGPR